MWVHCRANAEGMALNPFEGAKFGFGFICNCNHILFSTQPKIFFFSLQEVTKYMFLLTRKRFQHSSEYFGSGQKIVTRFAIVADLSFFSY